MTVDVVQALTSGKLVAVSRPTQAGERRGWDVARFVVHEELALWCVAAGIPAPDPPPVDGFDDVPQIMESLRKLDLRLSLSLDPDTRMAGAFLAQQMHAGPLHAVLTALDHAQYDSVSQQQLCEVEVALDRVLSALAGMALVRHDEDGPFDTRPWERAIEALAARL